MRYDVKIVLRQEFSLVEEAPSPSEAQAQALAKWKEVTAQVYEVEVHIEEGVR